MIFTQTPLAGAYLIDLERRGDDRGYFARTYCRREFAKYGLMQEIVQTNMSRSADKGTLRGLHYQADPHQTAKLVRCTKGAIFDFIVDLRPESPTYTKWYGVELSAANSLQLYVPERFAHGILTLQDDTDIVYLVNEYYYPEVDKGYRWDDPAFGIALPITPSIISPKDLSWEPFQVEAN